MELTFVIIVGVLFTLISLVCVATVVLGLPGAWMAIGLALIIQLFDPAWLSAGADKTFSWWVLGVCAILATIGEVLEFGAGAVGAKAGGSTKHGMWGALIGGIVGAIAGIAIPVPIVGSLIGAVIGSFVGAIAGERFVNREITLKQTLKPATGASIGRVAGTLVKVPIAGVIWLALSVDVFWR
jgi:uncharacterized protein YqgC (DUF456 family)